MGVWLTSVSRMQVPFTSDVNVDTLFVWKHTSDWPEMSRRRPRGFVFTSNTQTQRGSACSEIHQRGEMKGLELCEWEGVEKNNVLVQFIRFWLFGRACEYCRAVMVEMWALWSLIGNLRPCWSCLSPTTVQKQKAAFSGIAKSDNFRDLDTTMFTIPMRLTDPYPQCRHLKKE